MKFSPPHTAHFFSLLQCECFSNHNVFSDTLTLGDLFMLHIVELHSGTFIKFVYSVLIQFFDRLSQPLLPKHVPTYLEDFVKMKRCKMNDLFWNVLDQKSLFIREAVPTLPTNQISSTVVSFCIISNTFLLQTTQRINESIYRSLNVEVVKNSRK